MHPFYQYIQQYSSLDRQDWDLVQACLHRQTYRKGELILREGDICRNLYFLETGFLRFFTWQDGKDVSKFFTQPPYCFTSQRSFSAIKPALENIEVLDDCTVWAISRADTYRLLTRSSWSNFILELIKEVQFNTEQLLMAAQSETAETRYRKMLADGDVILQRAPLKYLASYLGIAPQSLSRIRQRMSSPDGLS